MVAPSRVPAVAGSTAPPRVLTVAGSDSGGGAGIQADLKTMLALGVHGMSVLTAVTAQNSVGVQGYWELPTDAVRAQLDSVLGDIGVDAVKTGMLASTSLLDAAKAVLDLGARAVLVKGGHLAGAESVDLLWDGEEQHVFSSPRYDNRHTHGTGCTLASAIASRLALGDRLAEAVAAAKDYL